MNVSVRTKRFARRAACLLLAAAMLISLIAGCGKKAKTDADTGERVTLSVGLPQYVNITDYDDNSLTKHLEEELNMDLKFEFFSSNYSEYTQQLTLLCTGGETIPDVLWGFVRLNRTTVNQLGEDGFIIDLTDLMKQDTAPNLNKRLDDLSEDVRENIMARGTDVNNGEFYALPTYTTSLVADYMQSLTQINRTWLDKLGLKAPANVDELYNVLKAFRDNDPNGNGQKDELPMMTSGIWYYVINAYVYYDINNRWNVTDGKVWNPVVTDEYRQALIFLNKLCKEGLLSDISLTIDGTEQKSILSGSGKTATVGIWQGQPQSGLSPSCEILDQYDALAPLDDATGKGGYGVQIPNPARFGGMISKDCKNPEAAMRFFDIFYTDEIATWLRHGEKGVDWEEGSGETMYRTDSHILIKNDRAFFEGNSTWGNTGTTWMTPYNNLAYMPSDASEYNKECERNLREQYDIMVKYRRPEELAVDLVYTDDQQAVKDDLEGSYTTYVNEALTLFIRGDMDPASDTDWQEYLDTTADYKADELLKVYQAAYDRTYGNKK